MALLTEAEAAQRAAALSRSKEAVIEGEIAPALASLRMRVTAELRPEVDALSAQVTELTLQGAETGTAILTFGVKLTAGQASFARATEAAQAADEAVHAVITRYGPDYEAKVAVLASGDLAKAEGVAARIRAAGAAKYLHCVVARTQRFQCVC